MIIWIIAFWVFVFLIYWLSKKEAQYNQIVKHYENLMSNDWKLEYMRNKENKEINLELQPKHRVCLTCMNRNKN